MLKKAIVLSLVLAGAGKLSAQYSPQLIMLRVENGIKPRGKIYVSVNNDKDISNWHNAAKELFESYKKIEGFSTTADFVFEQHDINNLYVYMQEPHKARKRFVYELYVPRHTGTIVEVYPSRPADMNEEYILLTKTQALYIKHDTLRKTVEKGSWNQEKNKWEPNEPFRPRIKMRSRTPKEIAYFNGLQGSLE